jgi:hypothetical protein
MLELWFSPEVAVHKPEEFAKLVDQLQSIYKLEKQLELQQKIIGRIKISLVRSFYK